MQRIELIAEPLTRAAFWQFGDVIEKDGAQYFETNGGTAVRYHDLARIETAAQGGRSVLSIFQASQATALPLRLQIMERHPISSQAFIPLDKKPFFVVVAPATQTILPHSIRAFVTNGRQGINFHMSIWHHPLIALSPSDFLVVDRTGPGDDFNQDYEEIFLDENEIVLAR
jgi:ureidoglycolate lyase